MKTLTGQTATATESITTQIAAMQTSTDKVIAAREASVVPPSPRRCD